MHSFIARREGNDQEESFYVTFNDSGVWFMSEGTADVSRFSISPKLFKERNICLLMYTIDSDPIIN